MFFVQIECQSRLQLEVMLVEFGIEGILLRFLVILGMYVVQQEIAIGDDIAYIFLFVGIA